MSSRKPTLSELYLTLAGGAEGCERAIAAQALTSSTIPRKLQGKDTRSILESWGFVFEDQLPEGHGLQGSDDLMQIVIMPPGWTKSSDGGYWTRLLDAKGHQRAMYFYKGDFWDRNAHLDLCLRFHASYTQDDGERDDPVTPVITDGQKIIWRGAKVPNQEFVPCSYKDAEGNHTDCPDCGPRWETKVVNCDTCGSRPFSHDIARHQAALVLNEHYPNHNSPTAYWDVDHPQLPAWGSQPPAGNRYQIWVGLYQMSTNSFYTRPEYVSGGHHDTIRALNDEDAGKQAETKLRDRFSSYDRVDWHVSLIDEKGEVVEEKVREGSWEKPRKQVRTRDGMYHYDHRTGKLYGGPDGFFPDWDGDLEPGWDD